MTSDTNRRDDALLTAVALIEQHNNLQAVSSLLYSSDAESLTRVLASVVSITRYCVAEIARLLDVGEGVVLAELRQVHTEHLRGRQY